MYAQLVLLLACGAAIYASSIKTLNSRRSSVTDGSARLGVYDGSKTSIKDHPSLGALLVDKEYFCQVTIVSDQHVLTIGDCVYGTSPSDLAVVVSSEDGLKGIKFAVDKVIPHPQYGKAQFDYNYAIVEIKGTFKWSDKVKAITLPKKPAARNTNMVVAGWGSTSSVDSEGEPNNDFLQGTMTWLDKKKCKKLYEQFGVVWTDRMACTYNKGKTTLCTGDWADAFVSKGVFYGMFQAGVTSGWCTSEAMPVLATDVTPVTGWIKTNTGAKYEDE